MLKFRREVHGFAEEKLYLLLYLIRDVKDENELQVSSLGTVSLELTKL